MFALGNLAKLLKKDGAIGTMAKQGGFEATEEGVDYVANYIADKAFKDPNAKFSWSELASNMGAGGLSGAVFAGTGVAANRVNADTNVLTRGAAQPILAEQINTMQKQLADMQFQQWVNELVAVYEKNVPNANTQFSTNSHMNRTIMEENADVQGILEMAKKNGKIELTEDMEDAIARKSFSEIEELKEKLPDRVVRKWYLAHDSTILQEIGQNGNLEQRARQAFELRNINREHARDLMENQEKRVELDRSDPNKTFEELISDKMKRKGLTREEALQDILNTAGKTRASVNKMFGLGE